MNHFRELAHLLEQIGEERFAALVSSDNTGKVKEFCDELLGEVAVPTTMTISGRTYELPSYLREGENSIGGETMVARAIEMSANSGEEEGRHLLDHQDEIPVALRGKVVFVFPGWRHPGVSSRVACVYWDGGRWILDWDWVGNGWGDFGRLLRRK